MLAGMTAIRRATRPPCGEGADRRVEEEAEATEDLAGSANVDEQEMSGEIRGDDANVGQRNPKVQDACGDEEKSKENARKHGYYGTAEVAFAPPMS